MTAPDKREEFDDGGPAFPCGAEDYNNGIVGPLDAGMTLLDYFACVALRYPIMGPNHGLPADYARNAYDLADAMIAEKRRREGAGGAQ